MDPIMNLKGGYPRAVGVETAHYSMLPFGHNVKKH
jgi:hypothetical protein